MPKHISAWYIVSSSHLTKIELKFKLLQFFSLIWMFTHSLIDHKGEDFRLRVQVVMILEIFVVTSKKPWIERDFINTGSLQILHVKQQLKSLRSKIVLCQMGRIRVRKLLLLYLNTRCDFSSDFSKQMKQLRRYNERVIKLFLHQFVKCVPKALKTLFY